MQIAHLLIIGLLGTVVPLQPLFADTDAEREALARLVQTAQSQAEPDRRIRFRYDWLRQDLSRVRQGIREHIDAPRAEPRTFPPLRADYRR
jgi:RAQPRD family integrative conjugative element protein